MAALTPEVQRYFKSEQYEDGETAEIRAPAPDSTIGAKKLLSLFEPEAPAGKEASSEPAIPLEFQGEDLKKLPAPPAAPQEPEEPASSSSVPASLYRPALALWLTCGALLATSAAAFACARRGATRAFCGQPAPFLPRGRRTRRRALLALGEEPANATAEPPASLLASVLAEDPAMDPADAAAVVAAVEARSAGGAFRAAAAPASNERAEGLAAFEADYAAASRAHVLDVRAHVLSRGDVKSALHLDPARELVDAVGSTEGSDYAHAFERSASEHPVRTADGGFVLGLRAHILRGAEGLLHQDPSIDLEDIMPVKAKARALKIRARLAGEKGRV